MQVEAILHGNGGHGDFKGGVPHVPFSDAAVFLVAVHDDANAPRLLTIDDVVRKLVLTAGDEANETLGSVGGALSGPSGLAVHKRTGHIPDDGFIHGCVLAVAILDLQARNGDGAFGVVQAFRVAGVGAVLGSLVGKTHVLRVKAKINVPVWGSGHGAGAEPADSEL